MVVARRFQGCQGSPGDRDDEDGDDNVSDDDVHLEQGESATEREPAVQGGAAGDCLRNFKFDV